jgi:peptide/nickel transport system substrate-binding protein
LFTRVQHAPARERGSGRVYIDALLLTTHHKKKNHHMKLDIGRRAAVAAGVGLLALMMAGCKPETAAKSTSTEPKRGGTFTVATNGQEPACLDPLVNASAGVIASRPYSDSLVWQTEKGEFVPWLAESWRISPDGKLYTFKLRKGVTFTDGAKFDANAVKANFDYIVNPATKSQLSAAYFSPYEKSVVIDDETVEVHLKQAYSAFINILAQSYFALLSPKQIAEAPQTTCDAPIGSGPFKLVKWNKGRSIEFVRNPDYNWGPPGSHAGAAYVEKFTLLFLGEDQVRYNSLLSGEVDAIDFVPPENVEEIKANPKFGFIREIRPGTSYAWHLNNARVPFNDLLVRQALLNAVDRKTIVAASSFGQWELSSFLTSSTPDYVADLKNQLTFDPARANQLLDKAGWTQRDGEGFRVKDGKRLIAYLPLDGTNASRRRLAEQAQAGARAVGIDIKIELLTWQKLSERQLAGDYDISAGLWSSNTADMLWLRFATNNISTAKKVGQNAAKFSDPSFDDIVEKARISVDPEQRRELYRDAQERLVELVPSIPLYGDPRTAAFPSRVKGVKFDYAYLQPFWFDVWLDD